MKTKKCTHCKAIKAVSKFSKRKSSKDGLQSWCKECTAPRAKQWREDNKEQASANYKRWERQNRQRVRENRRAWLERNPNYMREYLKRWHEENPGKQRKSLERSNARYPERVKAREILNAAVLRGDVIKPNACECCGQETPSRSLHGHHEDYSEPLEVVWLRDECHIELHKELRDKEAISP